MKSVENVNSTKSIQKRETSEDYEWYCGIDRVDSGTRVIYCPSHVASGYYCDFQNTKAFCFCSGNELVPSKYDNCLTGLVFDFAINNCNWPLLADRSKCEDGSIGGDGVSTQSPDILTTVVVRYSVDYF